MISVARNMRERITHVAYSWILLFYSLLFLNRFRRNRCIQKKQMITELKKLTIPLHGDEGNIKIHNQMFYKYVDS